MFRGTEKFMNSRRKCFAQILSAKHFPRHREIHELPPKVFCAEDLRGWHDFVLQYLLLVVDIVKKQVQRRDPLDETRFELLPLAGRNDARYKVEREEALREIA